RHVEDDDAIGLPGRIAVYDRVVEEVELRAVGQGRREERLPRLLLALVVAAVVDRRVRAAVRQAEVVDDHVAVGEVGPVIGLRGDTARLLFGMHPVARPRRRLDVVVAEDLAAGTALVRRTERSGARLADEVALDQRVRALHVEVVLEPRAGNAVAGDAAAA